MNHNSNSDNTNATLVQPNQQIDMEQTKDLPADATQSKNSSLANANNELELATFILDDTQPWQIHNCKVISKSCNKHGTLPFLYHYDRLPDEIKHSHPLEGNLLANFNTQMTAEQACQLIGVNKDNISQPWFVKIMGSVVIYHEPMQLALKLNWSNTNKQFDSIYCQTEQQAIETALTDWQFVNSIDVLYKKHTNTFIVFDEQATSIEHAKYIISQSASYERMPANFAISLIQELHKDIKKLAWLDKVIQEHLTTNTTRNIK